VLVLESSHSCICSLFPIFFALGICLNLDLFVFHFWGEKHNKSAHQFYWLCLIAHIIIMRAPNVAQCNAELASLSVNSPREFLQHGGLACFLTCVKIAWFDWAADFEF